MKSKTYAIIDLETTGGRPSRDKITEIAIILHDGEKVIDTFETLINPECYIPYGITQLTGISMDMVQDAPKFYEVAKQIVEMTKGTIFVAHNVRFDYNFIRAEFERLGFTYSRRKLCTVRLSRKVFPGLPSYGLDHLIKFMDIEVAQRHRAMGDAKATAHLLKLILEQEHHELATKELINLGIKESLLPKTIDLDRIHALPEACGVYYFYDQNGQVVYVGKSINIQKRVAEHFAKQTSKAKALQDHVHDISFELTGSELIALLLESYEIKRLSPPINKAQKNRRFPYIVHTYEDSTGFIRFTFEKTTAQKRKKLKVLSEYPTLGRAKGHLIRMVHNYELCNKLSGLESGTGPCFNFHLKQCHGACAGVESMESYNERATIAKEGLRNVFEEDFFIIDQGRNQEELGVVLVEGGHYQGFGYMNKEESIMAPEHLKSCIRSYPGNAETSRIIQRFLNDKSKVKTIPFQGMMED